MKIKSVLLLVIAHAATDINQGAIPVFLPFFIAEHHISYTAAATIVFAVNIVSTTTQPLFGYMTDRRSRPWFIPLSMVIVALGVSFTGVAPTYRTGLLTLMVAGLGIALFHPEGARLMNFLAGDKKATAMSLFGIGGQLGFAVGPLMATVVLLCWGLKGTLVFIVPTIFMAALLSYRLPALLSGYQRENSAKGDKSMTGGRDNWPAFVCLSSALLCRSVVFYGLNTFLPLYWINVLKQSKGAGGSALTIMLCSLIVGNFLGGRSAERYGYKAVTVTGFACLAAALPFLSFMGNPIGATLILVPIGFFMSIPFGPMVALGQIYLPNRVGLASGITLGVAFSFGGLVTPFFGWLADHYGLSMTIMTISFLPVLCLGFALMLPSVKTPGRH